MAVNNRTEAISQVNVKIVPTVTNAVHKDLLNNDVLNSIVFRKDVIISAIPAVGAVTADFTNGDLVTIAFTESTTITFAGLENGDVKYLHITKNATHVINFAGATNSTNFQSYINNKSTVVAYAVYNKNNVIYVVALKETIIEAVKADITAADAYKFTTAKAVANYVDTIFAPPSVDITKWTNANGRAYSQFDNTALLSIRLIPLTTNESIVMTLGTTTRPPEDTCISAIKQGDGGIAVISLFIEASTGEITFSNSAERFASTAGAVLYINQSYKVVY